MYTYWIIAWKCNGRTPAFSIDCGYYDSAHTPSPTYDSIQNKGSPDAQMERYRRLSWKALLSNCDDCENYYRYNYHISDSSCVFSITRWYDLAPSPLLHIEYTILARI